jgi:hypothetical protein
MLSFQLFRTVIRIRFGHAEPGVPIEIRDFAVQNSGVTGQGLGDVLRLQKDPGFDIGRVQSGDQTSLATDDSRKARWSSCSSATACGIPLSQSWVSRPPSIGRPCKQDGRPV